MQYQRVQKQKEKITISLEKRINVISHQGAMERAAARGAGGVAPGMELGVEDNKLYCCVQLLLLSIMGCCGGVQFQILIAFVISHLAISDSDCFYNFPPCTLQGDFDCFCNFFLCRASSQFKTFSLERAGCCRWLSLSSASASSASS